MTLRINFSDFVFKEKKNLYLILILPITLFIGSAVTNSVIIAIIIIFLIDCKKDNNFYFLKNKNFHFLIFFSIYLILNSIFLGKNIESITRSVGFLRFVILAFAIDYYLSLENRKYEKTIFKFWTLIFLFVTFDLFIEYFLKYNLFTGYTSEYLGRLGGLTGPELKIGGFYFGFVLLALTFITSNNKKIIYLFFMLFLIIAFLIGERSNFIKIFIISSIFILFFNKNLIVKNLIFLLVIMVIGIFVIINNQNFKLRYYNQIIEKVIQLKNNVSTITHNKHLEHYATAIQVIKKNPIFGVGVKQYRYESFKKEYNTFNNVSINGMGNHPHQIHFELLAELGFVGYFPLMYYFIYFILKSFNNFRKNNNFYLLSSLLFIFASILPILPSGSFFTTYTATIFWINYSIVFSKSSNLKN